MTSKYKARKTVVNGVVFDSKKEAERFVVLKRLECLGAITGLKTQVPFELIPAQREWIIDEKTGATKKGKVIERAIVYKADFVYNENGKTVIEDVKGYRRGGAYAVFTIKRKLLLYNFGIKIKEV